MSYSKLSKEFENYKKEAFKKEREAVRVGNERLKYKSDAETAQAQVLGSLRFYKSTDKTNTSPILFTLSYNRLT